MVLSLAFSQVTAEMFWLSGRRSYESGTPPYSATCSYREFILSCRRYSSQLHVRFRVDYEQPSRPSSPHDLVLFLVTILWEFLFIYLFFRAHLYLQEHRRYTTLQGFGNVRDSCYFDVRLSWSTPGLLNSFPRQKWLCPSNSLCHPTYDSFREFPPNSHIHISAFRNIHPHSIHERVSTSITPVDAQIPISSVFSEPRNLLARTSP